jgi:hypothetical protein
MSIYKKSIEQKKKILDDNKKFISIPYPDTEFKYVGSFVKENINIFSDIDITQIIKFNNKNEIDFYNELNTLIKKLPKNFYFNYLKCGIKEDKYIYIGNIIYPFSLVNYNTKKIIIQLKKAKLEHLVSLVKENPTIQEYMTLFNSIKDEYRLPNINKSELLDYKTIINKQYYKYKTRINFIWEIEKDFYLEVSNTILFGYKNNKYYINTEKGSHPLITYYDNLINENYLKCIKLLYTRILYLKNEKIKNKVSKYLNSKINILNLIINYLSLLLTIYELNISSFKSFDKQKKALIKQLKPVVVKEELQSVVSILKEIKKEENIQETINELDIFIKNNSKKALIEFTKEFNETDYLLSALNNKIPLL